LGLLGATYWLTQQVRVDIDIKNNESRHTPDAIVENFSSTKLDKKGTPQLIVSAEKMLHYPDNNNSELQMPNIISFSDRNTKIHISAKKGIITDKGDDIYLNEYVEVRRDATTQQAALILQTDYLRLTPKLHLARSDKAVTLRTTDSIIRAVGFEMNSQARTLKLLSQVKSEYAPQNN
jgi:lipopolysaccharide export system protein LptC